MSKHLRRTCLRSVALKAEDTALIWMLISAKNKKSLVNAKCYPKEVTSPIYLCRSIFLHSLVDLVTATHNHIWGK